MHQDPGPMPAPNPRFKRIGKSWRYNGKNIHGYIELTRYGLAGKRWIANAHGIGSLSFAERDIDNAKQWLIRMDEQQETKQ
jgi:hypothetical protein